MRKIALSTLMLASLLIFTTDTHAQTTTATLRVPAGHAVVEKVTQPQGKEDTRLIITDYLNSARVEVSQGVQKGVEYYPYGSTAQEATGEATLSTDNQFTSHRKLTGTDVYHAQARFYNPRLAQFIQADHVEGPNRYAYVGGNPIQNSDPTGTFCVPCIVGGLAIGGMFLTSPAGSTPADTPGEIAMVNNWEAKNGEGFNYGLSRLIPGIGQAHAVNEILTGKDSLDREVGISSTLWNAVEAGSTLLGSGSYIDEVAGGLHTAIQQRKVLRIDQGINLFGGRIDDAQKAMRTHTDLYIDMAKNKLDMRIHDLSPLPSAGQYAYDVKPGAGKFFPSWRAIFVNGIDSLDHEIVHALQYINDATVFKTRLRTFRAEMMAYASTTYPNGGLTSHLAGTASSMNNDSLSFAFKLLGKINEELTGPASFLRESSAAVNGLTSGRDRELTSP